jgi:hypothetical protein
MMFPVAVGVPPLPLFSLAHEADNTAVNTIIIASVSVIILPVVLPDFIFVFLLLFAVSFFILPPCFRRCAAMPACDVVKPPRIIISYRPEGCNNRERAPSAIIIDNSHSKVITLTQQ